ncbi:MAG: substrate-binding domain-containing protein [Treponema sp.]|nr:substrate-binding domain-containing protein [Treponema sp.]
MRIGLVLNVLDEEYQISLYRGIKKRAQELGIQIVCFQEGNTAFLSDAFIGCFPRKDYFKLDGIILLTSVLIDNCTLNTKEDIYKIWGSTPVISVGQKIEGIPSLLIRTDDSMNELMEHLIKYHGYRNLVYIGGSQTHQDAILREELFVNIIQKYKASIPQLEYKIEHGSFTEQSAVEALDAYMQGNKAQVPDVIVCANDNMAIGVYKYLKLNQQEHPEFSNVAVTGFDDIPQGQFSIPSLTTVHQPLDQIGEEAVNIIYQYAKGQELPFEKSIGSCVVYRESCGCKKQEADASVIRDSFNKVQSSYVVSEQMLQIVSRIGRDLNHNNDEKTLASIIDYNIGMLGIKNFCILKYPQKMQQNLPLSDNPLFVEPLYVRYNGRVIDMAKNTKDGQLTLGQFYDYLNTLNKQECEPLVYKNLNVGEDYIGCILYDAPDNFLPYIILISVDIALAINRIQLNEERQRYSEFLECEVSARMHELVEANSRRLKVEAEVLEISEIERQRFSNDLHDDICQRLAGISMLCRSYSHKSEGVKKEEMEELAALVSDTLQRTRQYAHDSYPVDLDTLGLDASLSNLCNSFEKQSGIGCTYEWGIDPEVNFDKLQKLNFFRIIQEALHNVMKHSGAHSVKVCCMMQDRNVVIRVCDDGKGMPSMDGSNYGIGINSMQYRANQIGASFSIDNLKNGGVCVEVKL